mgnify:CR=1 FL=1
MGGNWHIGWAIQKTQDQWESGAGWVHVGSSESLHPRNLRCSWDFLHDVISLHERDPISHAMSEFPPMKCQNLHCRAVNFRPALQPCVSLPQSNHTAISPTTISAPLTLRHWRKNGWSKAVCSDWRTWATPSLSSPYHKRRSKALSCLSRLHI